MIVVGCGRGQSHARSMLALSDKFELVGLVDLDEKRLKTAIDNLGLSADLAYTSLAEALEKSECDGVVVATWARSHDPLVEEAIEAGKHIMVEKPFTLEVAPAPTPDGDGGGTRSENRCDSTVALHAGTAHDSPLDDG